MITVQKRDGRKERFDKTKVDRAVKKCLVNNLNAREFDAAATAHQISDAVDRIVKNGEELIGVEDVQRLVIQQLWAANCCEAAEQYTLHRERRRLERVQNPIPPDDQAFIDADVAHFATPLQYYQFLSKFSRWQDHLGRRETWREACNRVMNWFRSHPQANVLNDSEWKAMESALYEMRATCAMRVLQMAGPALNRCNIGVYNCSYAPIIDTYSFAELLYVLMQGTGAGFSIESDYVDQLPKIKKQKNKGKEKYKIPDSTEGWCDALKYGLDAWFAGDDVEFDYSAIRPKGSRLKTKGGRASGPEPLRELLTFARNLLLSKQGQRLEDVDVHDLCCMIGRIVQVGGVRRAAEISLSDLDSTKMREAKSGNWYQRHQYREQANNSAVYESKPSDGEFMEEWLALYKAKSGERGIFNRWGAVKNRPPRRKKAKFGSNPCGEIILPPWSMCNLTIAVARPNDTSATLRDKVIIATYFGVVQSLHTNFGYVRSEWKKNCEDERLLGVDITGHADCSLLQYGAPERDQLLRDLRNEVAKVRQSLAKRFGINESAADTCIKPGGDSAVLFDCASGVSPRFSDYQRRWVRESKDSPMSKFLIDEGVPYASPNESQYMFGFPKKNPEGSTKRNDLTAIQQMENWLEWKRHWAEHSVSATIYVDEHEWMEAGAWVLRHFDEITGLSFLPKDNGNYRHAPNEEINKELYDQLVAKFPKINWAKLRRYETGETQPNLEYACVGGACET